MLSGANAFEISDIKRMNIGAHQPGVWHVTMLHALGLPEITIRQEHVHHPSHHENEQRLAGKVGKPEVMVRLGLLA
jgi:hypothetical protein